MDMTWTGSRIAALLVAAAAGFGLARWTSPTRLDDALMQRLERQEARLEALASRLEAQSMTPAVPGTRSVVGVDLSGMREELRQMLREEMRTVVSSAGAEVDAGGREPVAPPPTQENAEAFAKARQLVGDSLAARRWGEAEIQSLRGLRGQLTGSQYHELVLELVNAINDRRLRVETSGPPF